EPGFARLAVQRPSLSRRELVHDLCQARGFVADRAVVQELGARAAWRGEDFLLVVGGVDAARAAFLRFYLEAPQTPRIGVVAGNAAGKLRLRRQLRERRAAGVLNEAHAERPERGLGRIAHEAARLVAVVAMPVPAPRGNMDRVPRLPLVTHAVDFGPAAALHHEEDRIPRVPMNGRHNSGID